MFFSEIQIRRSRRLLCQSQLYHVVDTAACESTKGYIGMFVHLILSCTVQSSPETRTKTCTAKSEPRPTKKQKKNSTRVSNIPQSPRGAAARGESGPVWTLHLQRALKWALQEHEGDGAEGTFMDNRNSRVTFWGCRGREQETVSAARQ